MAVVIKYIVVLKKCSVPLRENASWLRKVRHSGDVHPSEAAVDDEERLAHITAISVGSVIVKVLRHHLKAAAVGDPSRGALSSRDNSTRKGLKRLQQFARSGAPKVNFVVHAGAHHHIGAKGVDTGRVSPSVGAVSLKANDRRNESTLAKTNAFLEESAVEEADKALACSDHHLTRSGGVKHDRTDGSRGTPGAHRIRALNSGTDSGVAVPFSQLDGAIGETGKDGVGQTVKTKFRSESARLSVQKLQVDAGQVSVCRKMREGE